MSKQTLIYPKKHPKILTVTRNILSFLIITVTVACSKNEVSTDYFGQPEPQSTPVIFGEGTISQKGRFEHGISFAPDNSELLLGILRADESGYILHSEKATNSWTSLQTFKPLENQTVFLPYFSPDGNSLLYAQSKDALDTNYVTDIWSLEKVNGTWSNPSKMQSPLSSDSREANASMTSDGTIYFSSNRNCEGKENCFTADLFSSKRVNHQYQTATEIAALNTASDEESVFISPEEEYLLFCRYTDNETSADLYISYRDYNNNWAAPQLLDPGINSADWDRRPFVSADNKFLFFTRLQSGEQGLIESDIYWVNTSKVFKPFVFNKPADIEAVVGEKFEVSIPEDYFKDINDAQLTVSSNAAAFDWLSFDSKTMKLSGLPTQAGEFELIFTAVDGFSNSTENILKLIVQPKK